MLTTLGLWIAPRCVQSARMTPSAASRVDVSAAPGLAISTPSTTCIAGWTFRNTSRQGSLSDRRLVKLQ